jgi:hypothetical protein
VSAVLFACAAVNAPLARAPRVAGVRGGCKGPAGMGFVPRADLSRSGASHGLPVLCGGGPAGSFFTQEAREVIEKAGVVVFKDASANKGGVTSSSLEVLCALVLNDEEFRVHMAGPKSAGKPSEDEVRACCRCRN